MNKRSVLWTCDKQKLSNLVKNSNTFSQIIKYFGMVVAGCQIRSLKQRLDYDGIDYSHIPQGLGAGRGRINFVVEPLSPNIVLIDNSPHSRKTAKKCILRCKLIPYGCDACHQKPEWNGKPLTLILDHKNGKNNDHRLENLRFLCPNCNSQADTFGSRNIKVRHNCNECGIPITKYSESGLCSKCVPRNHMTSIPLHDELEKMVWSIPAVAIARQYGVSDKAVAKWCKKYKIKKPGPGYWRSNRPHHLNGQDTTLSK